MVRTMNLKGLICPIISVTPILHTNLDQIVFVEKKIISSNSFIHYILHSPIRTRHRVRHQGKDSFVGLVKLWIPCLE